MPARRSPAPGRVALIVLGGGILFAGLSALFVQLLQPFPLTTSEGAGSRDFLASNEEAPVPDVQSDAGPRALDQSAVSQGTRAAAGTSAPAADPTADPLPEGALVAILMTELGPDATASRRAIEDLPEGVTFTFSPYAEISPSLALEAHADGHEVFVSVPMEPQRYPRINPGENTLLRNSGASENLERLAWALDRFDDTDGTTGMMGSAFTQDAAALRPVMKALHMRGLTYIDARASARSVAAETARDAGVPAQSNDRFLDEPATSANIETNLSALFATAKRRGYAIGYARPTAATIDALSDIDARAEEAGISLVGASRLARGLQDRP